MNTGRTLAQRQESQLGGKDSELRADWEQDTSDIVSWRTFLNPVTDRLT